MLFAYTSSPFLPLCPASPPSSSNGDLHEIAGLFRQVQGLQPSAMACPPNLWNGLYIMYKSILSDMQANAQTLTGTLTRTQDPERCDAENVGMSSDRSRDRNNSSGRHKEADFEVEALSKISSLFGPRIKFLVTGGGPTAAEVTVS